MAFTTVTTLHSLAAGILADKVALWGCSGACTDAALSTMPFAPREIHPALQFAATGAIFLAVDVSFVPHSNALS